jgi:hypothetical protein
VPVRIRATPCCLSASNVPTLMEKAAQVDRSGCVAAAVASAPRCHSPLMFVARAGNEADPRELGGVGVLRDDAIESIGIDLVLRAMSMLNDEIERLVCLFTTELPCTP